VVEVEVVNDGGREPFAGSILYIANHVCTHGNLNIKPFVPMKYIFILISIQSQPETLMMMNQN